MAISRQTIFRSDADRKYYLERLEQYRRRYESKVYAHVLMSNHVHLLLETRAVPLSRIMQGLQFRYTGYFYRKYNKVRHLFQGHYKAILCDRDTYLLELVRYLHRNPERMRSPMQAVTYRWSRYGAYLGKDNLVSVETALVLVGFAKSLDKARLGYLRFMAEGRVAAHQPQFYDVHDQRFLGDERFVEEIGERVYLGREWCRLSLEKLAKLLHRDHRSCFHPFFIRPTCDFSVISRQYSSYAAARDERTEAALRRQLRLINAIRKPDP